MRGYTTALVAAAAMAAAGAAHGEDIRGTIAAIDLAHMQVTLEGGDVLALADPGLAEGLAAGDVVAAHLEDAKVQALRKMDAPVPEFTWSPINPYYRIDVTFDATKSHDDDGQIVRYSWDFGDGTTAEGMIVQHKFRDGNYRVRLTVEDNDGLTRTTWEDIPVTETPRM